MNRKGAVKMDKLEYRGQSMRTKKLFKIAVIVLAVLIGIVVIVSVVLKVTDKNPHNIDVNNAGLTQLDTPKDDQEVAIIKTTLGTMKVALYREFAPNTVENFVNQAKSGYYDGTFVFQSEPSIYFIGGGKTNDGTGGTNTKITTEVTSNLWPFKGALCSIADGNTKKGGNKILFINSIEFTEEIKTELRGYDMGTNLIEAFIEKGGIPNFVGQYSVFAQTYDGMDVFEEISSISSDETTKQLSEDVKIESVTITTYGEDVKNTQKS